MSEISETLESLPDDEVVRAAGDRSTNIDPYVTQVLRGNSPQLQERSPHHIYLDDTSLATGLDFFSVASYLAEEESQIRVDRYERVLPKQVREGEMSTSEEQRFGRLLQVVSNQDNHSFSLMLLDQTVLQADGNARYGMPRNFNMVNPVGEWYQGFGDVEVLHPQNRVYEELKEHFHPESRRRMTFKHFVNPNLALAFYGARNIRLKALCRRLTDEHRAYRNLEARIKERIGINLDPDERYKPGRDATNLDYIIMGWEDVSEGEEEKEPIEVTTLESRLEGFKPQGRYPVIAMDRAGNTRVINPGTQSFFPVGKGDFPEDTWKDILRYCEHRKKITWSLAAHRIRALSRAIDLAFFKHGFKGERRPGNEIRPWWKVPEWKPSDKKGEWHHIQLGGGIFLNYRLFSHKENLLEGALEKTRSTQDLYIY